MLVALLLFIFVPSTLAQTNVYVTTQDYSSLRIGPGKNFERIAIIDPAVTLPAIGRSPTTNWVQVEYNGMRGWIAARLLVWSGDIISLPVDGIDPVPYVRKQIVVGEFTTTAPIYAREIAPSDQVGTLPGGTQVELTGRLGNSSNGMFWVQIYHEGVLYWTGSWNIRLISGGFGELQDTSYLYPYGRLVTNLSSDLANASRRLNSTESLWSDLNDGFSVACDPARTFASTSRATETDVRQEPIFAPALAAYDAGLADLNSAIAAFNDACNREELEITQQEVRAALLQVDSARRNFNLSFSLMNSLGERNPLLGN